MLTTMPLEAFVCREVMTNYWFPDEAWDPHRHLIFTTSLVVTAVTLSLLTCDLGAVFEMIGATSACALAYILPPLCYMKLSTRSWKMIPACMCVGFGAIVMAMSLIQATAQIIRSSNTFQHIMLEWLLTFSRRGQCRSLLNKALRLRSGLCGKAICQINRSCVVILQYSTSQFGSLTSQRACKR